ncbi:MAG: N-acetyl-gamma-glutamyl-phosphate reductase [Clostridia bacterium]|nr:N-acetyl-gamma-glutamyl-phosphate reductase [Clostridia bacterium]
MTKVFIDGSQGTTGLKIFDRLSTRDDIELITLPEELRKDSDARKKALNSADIAFLCLPDDAAREAVSFIESENTVVIDTSTAHRTNDDWAYGFPELSAELESKLKASKKIAVPGCYASGFIALVKPLVDNGFIDAKQDIFAHAISGYSGAGKKGIAQYEDENRDTMFDAPREYALTQEHKHLKEMKIISGLENEPVFSPYVCDYFCGMVMTVPILLKDLKNGKTADDIKNLYKSIYNSNIVKYKESIDENGFISGNAMAENDGMEITVAGNEQRILLIARYDNLGKGASGAALECMNFKMGQSPEFMLNI